MIQKKIPLFILLTSILSIGLLKAYTQAIVKPLMTDVLMTSEKQVLDGYLAQRLNTSYNNRILAQDEPRLIEPFKNRTEDRCWQTEFWGKWFTSAVLAYRYRPEPALKALLDKAVADLLKTQTTDGYIGNYRGDKRLQQWDIWGRKYCMLGLLAYYDITQDKKSLQAARKILDHLIIELQEHKALISKQGNHRGMAATSILEPVCLLYNRTGEKKYLDFAKEIVRQWETPQGPQLISKAGANAAERFPRPATWWSWDQGQKAYEMMSCYEGLLELYRITGINEYKEAVEKTWANIYNTEINIAGSGSSVECWFGGKNLQAFPIKKNQETCVTATWIKLSQQLFRLTGDAKYADAIEQAYYNALLGAMSEDGADWAKYSPLSGLRLKGDEQCGMGINCCVASGPRGLFTLPQTVVMQSTEGINVNFFTGGTYRLHTPQNQSIQIVQTTDYPVSGQIRVKINLAKPEKFGLKIRIPSWSRQTELKVNDETVQGIAPGSYATINRSWNDGDQISLSLDMRGRVIKIGEKPEHLAVLRGPLVLARDSRLGGSNVDDAIRPVTDKEGYCEIEVMNVNKNNIWIQYKIPVTLELYIPEGGELPVSSLLFCDYSSAGNTISEQSRFRVWLPQLIDPAKKE